MILEVFFAFKVTRLVLMIGKQNTSEEKQALVLFFYFCKKNHTVASIFTGSGAGASAVGEVQTERKRIDFVAPFPAK